MRLLMIISLASRKVFLQLFAHMYLRVLLTAIGWMAATISVVLLTSKRHLTTLTIGYCSGNLLIVTVFSHALLVYYLIGTAINRLLSIGRIATHSALVYLVDVRQGGILSPYLFKYCMSETCWTPLLPPIYWLQYCWLYDEYPGICSADDMVLVAPSWRGLQCLLALRYPAWALPTFGQSIYFVVCCGYRWQWLRTASQFWLLQKIWQHIVWTEEQN